MARLFIICLGLVVSFQLAALAGCKSASGTDDFSSDPSPSPSPSPGGGSPTASAGSPLQLKLSTKYDTADYKNSLIFAETGNDTCIASTASPSVTCTVTVPEGRLYYSALIFQYSWMTSNCKIMIFQPYYYKRSTSATYTPPAVPGASASAVDCSADPAAVCFGGAATQLVESFPTFTSLIHFPDETDTANAQTGTATLPSGYSVSAGSNRYASDNIASANKGTSFTAAQMNDPSGYGDGYVANSFVDYKFSCRDDWFDPETYTIDLRINEENSDSGNIDNIGSWEEL